MPTTLTHAVLGAAAAKVFGEQQRPVRLWCAAIVASALPDADTLGFSLGVRYGAPLGHRGFFHSLFFALLVGIACATLLFRQRPLSRAWWKYVALFFLVGASHGVLDAFTDGGLGVALLAPFDDARYFFAWTPIPVAPIGFWAFFSYRNLYVVLWEIAHLWLPAFAAVAGVLLVRSRRHAAREA